MAARKAPQPAKRLPHVPASKAHPDHIGPGEFRNGVAADEYNAAIDLQVAVRNVSKRDVTMLEALHVARLVFERMPGLKWELDWIEAIDQPRETRERARLDEKQRISKDAGRRRGDEEEAAELGSRQVD